jgi:hypothetical protein
MCACPNGVAHGSPAEVVYANYGTPDDFAALEALGVDVKGKIVLARYGKCFRGLKVRAQVPLDLLVQSVKSEDGRACGRERTGQIRRVDLQAGLVSPRPFVSYRWTSLMKSRFVCRR